MIHLAEPEAPHTSEPKTAKVSNPTLYFLSHPIWTKDCSQFVTKLLGMDTVHRVRLQGHPALQPIIVAMCVLPALC